jgi:polyribonucleotide nucleotidyltransferase
MSIKKFETEWGGRALKVEIGRLAKQASASCTVQYGDTVVLATVVISDTKREAIDYFPLTCDFEERLYAAGKIKSSRFMKREGKASDDAILTGRMIDRAIRPLFNDETRNDVQVILTPLSVDQENDSDIPAMIGASVVLSISKIPWNGPIIGTRVGLISSSDEGKKPEFVLNPTFLAREKSTLDLIVAGTPEKVLMLEAGASEVSEDVMFEAIKFGQKHFKEVYDFILKIQKEVGVEKIPLEEAPASEDEAKEREEKKVIIEKTKKFLDEKAPNLIFGSPRASKSERAEIAEVLELAVDEHLKNEQIGKEKRKAGVDYVWKYIEKAVSDSIIEKDLRVDGRGLKEIRSLSADTNIIPRTHGSSLFQRGETQVLSVVTLGAPGNEQIIEGVEFSGKKRYFHHYNFPPYSVGEVGSLRGPGRREIGHGALAEKALLPVLPTKEEFPYTIRVVSEVLGSNGSSSMGSTCASSLALMAAGVPIKKPVAGIAIGIATNEKGDYKIITDLQDLEDGKGGMDFKVTGTTDGITAIQLDTKTDGLSLKIVEETLKRAYEARLNVLEVMNKQISEPNKELSPYAPRVETILINPDKIRDVIGPGGKIINEIIDKTGAEIDIEQDGKVFVSAVNKDSLDRAVEWVKKLTHEVQPGEIYTGTVSRIMTFGAFVEILPGQDGLVHISELAPNRVDRVEDVVNIGDEITVKVIEIDEKGRINLSLKQAQGFPATPKPPRDDNRGGFRDRGGDRRGGRR